MEAQGHHMTEVMFEQDNESAIRLETNGRTSADRGHATLTSGIFGSRTNEAGRYHNTTLPHIADAGGFFTKQADRVHFSALSATSSWDTHM
jgi:hypothetical protein